jgi:hypothetical protein
VLCESFSTANGNFFCASQCLLRKCESKKGFYKPREKALKLMDSPATSAVKLGKPKENLTLHDWMTVFAFIGMHKDIQQVAIVEHFKTKKDGALFFAQSTLSQKMKMRVDFLELA